MKTHRAVMLTSSLVDSVVVWDNSIKAGCKTVILLRVTCCNKLAPASWLALEEMAVQCATLREAVDNQHAPAHQKSEAVSEMCRAMTVTIIAISTEYPTRRAYHLTARCKIVVSSLPICLLPNHTTVCLLDQDRLFNLFFGLFPREAIVGYMVWWLLSENGSLRRFGERSFLHHVDL